MAKKLNDSTIATITTLDNTDYLNPVIAATGEIQKITIANMRASLGLPLVYAGNMQQSGTSNPTINETINTTGATFTATRVGAGSYELTCSTTLFGVNKVLCFFNNSTSFASSIGASRSDSDTISILTAGTDSILTLCSFKIEIYPQ